MEFKNRPNQCVWLSRSIAVLAVIFFQCNGKTYVPLGKRRDNASTCPGRWGLTAGYLDWDETATECLIREVWEELGLNLPALGEPYMGVLRQPYYVFSDPLGDAAQNVTLRYHCTYQVNTLPEIHSSQEVAEAAWFTVEDAKEMDLAFNHAAILSELYF